MRQTQSLISEMAQGMMGSEILKIATDVRAMLARGEQVVNLTVGDFRPDIFPIPDRLHQELAEAVRRRETNYPPSDGMLELRQTVARFYAERLGLEYPMKSVVITGGVRPAIYTAYRVLLNPGDTFVYPVPSWNNTHYGWILGSHAVEVVTSEKTHFLPTAEDLKPHLAGARVLLLNSPLNPAGTAYTEDQLERIVALVLDVNARRSSRGEPPLMVIYDQVYWMLTFGNVRHVTPVGIDRRMRDYTLFCDGISKAFAATGLRVGWCVGPEEYIGPISNLLGHVGAWAPRPEQIATTRLLSDNAAIDAYHAVMKSEIERRLTGLHEGFEAMRRDGYPVENIAPQAAIYLSVQMRLNGRRAGTRKLVTNEDIRAWLLETAHVALVPFQAFGYRGETGWFRLSVGALPMNDLERMFPDLRRALDTVESDR